MTVFAKLPPFRLLARERVVVPIISRFVITDKTERQIRDILAGISELKGEPGPVGVGEEGKQGEQGEPGVGTAGRRGRRGVRGFAPDHNVKELDDGYQLRFMQPSGEWGPIVYVKQGEQGEVGPPGVGEKGEKGDTGDPPDHEWRGTALRFRRANGAWGELVNLQGQQGFGGGGRGRSANPGFDSIALVGTDLVFSRASAGPLGPTITVDLSSLGGGGGTGDESLTYFLGE